MTKIQENQNTFSSQQVLNKTKLILSFFYLEIFSFVFYLKKNEIISMSKFEHLCNELDNSLKREEQAQKLLYQQSSQLEDLTRKIANIANEENQSNKFKEVIFIYLK
jgi:hypothetical protein